MCIAIPVRIIKIKDHIATVDIGDSNTTKVDVSLVEAKHGDYLIVNTGFGIRVVDEKEAHETIKIWNKMQETLSNET